MLKDLYQEMEKMKQGSFQSSILFLTLLYGSQVTSKFSDLKAAREKNGIYIPHERFVLEEAEKKVYTVSKITQSIFSTALRERYVLGYMGLMGFTMLWAKL
jgi:hypothetical protein